jgi:ABC-2 type transport system permease protein
METWVDIFWNSSLQMIVFSFIAFAFSRTAGNLYGTYMVVGMILWNIVWSAEYSFTIGVLWEIWSRSFKTLLITPLTLEEFLLGQAVSGFIKGIISVLVTASIGYAIFHFSLSVLGWHLMIYFLQLFLFGCSAGMIVLSLILRWGTDVQSFAWSLVFLVQPFGAVFYPVEILPVQIRWVAYGVPTTYVFEAIRQQLGGGGFNTHSMWVGVFLNIVYLVLSYLILRFTFVASKSSGRLARME